MYLAYCPSKSIALSSPPGCAQCWFVGVFHVLEFVGISMDQLPPFKYSLDAVGHLLPTRHELNRIIRDDFYWRFVQVTWINPQGGLHLKMDFYTDHFMLLREILIVVITQFVVEIKG
jgi:hypothetical protein